MAESCIVKASQKDDFLKALAFILPHEKTCCLLVRKVLDREDGVFLIVRKAGGRDIVDGVFFFIEDDVLLPCLSGIRGCGLKALASFLEGKKLFCIMGLENDLCKLRRLLSSLKKAPFLKERRSFFLFEHQKRDAALNAVNSLPDDFQIKIASEDYIDLLFPLHLSYVREEVALDGSHINESVERKHFRRSLEKEVVVMACHAFQSDCAIGKASTNAIASKTMQLGGVYTKKDFRNRGIAAALTAFLAESASKKGMSTVLFVNKKNIAAIAAYHKAGFCDIGKDYTIEYYE